MKKNNYCLYSLLSLIFILLSIVKMKAQEIEIIADHVKGVNGLSLDANGNLWFTLPGSGNDDGKVMVIDSKKSIFTVIVHVPSYLDTVKNELISAWKAYPKGNQLDVIVGGHQHNGSSSITQFDLSHWKIGDQALEYKEAISITRIESFLAANGFADSDPYRMVLDQKGNAIIVDAGANAVLKKDASTNQLSILHDFPPYLNTFSPSPPYIDYVPTCIVKNSAGVYYIGNLTGFPYINGLSSVIKMDEQGSTFPFIDSMTLIADMDIDKNGNIYTLQLGRFDTSFNPILFAHIITKITPAGNKSLFAQNFTTMLSSGFVLDGTGGFYVNDFALGLIKHVTKLSSVKDLSDKKESSLYASPNPFKNMTMINFNLSENSKVIVCVFDTRGKLILTDDLGLLEIGNQQYKFSAEQFSVGTYLLTISTKNKTSYLRVVKN